MMLNRLNAMFLLMFTEAEEVLAEFVRTVEKQFPAQVQSLKAGLSKETRAKLDAAATMS